MPNTLLIDINAIGYSAQQATKLTSGGMETQAAFGIMKTMRELRMTYPQYTPLVLWDGRAQWRYDLYPGYKGNRNSDPKKIAMKEAYAKQKPYIERGLSALGIRQLTCVTAEADDMAGHFVRKLSADPTHKIGVITGDQDWLQFIRPNVWWRDMRDDSRFVTVDNFYKFTGCRTPMEFLEVKCLQGDGSDTITGVGGIGKEGAPLFIAQHGSVLEFWRKCDAGLHKPESAAEHRLWKGECEFDREQWAAQLDLSAVAASDAVKAKMLKQHLAQWPGQGRKLFRRNFQLMQLLQVPPPKREHMLVNPGKFDKDAFAEVCGELAFISILKNLDEYVNLFKGNTP